jgi:alpha-tubulin suppressor-like RCC1 family protein
MVHRMRSSRQMGDEVGQLGNGTDRTSARPVQVRGLTDVIAIAASGDDSFALKKDGTVWACGDNRQGRLGDGTNSARTSPVQVKNLSGVTEIAAGAWCGFAWTKYGAIWAFGDTSSNSSNVPLRLSQFSR